MIMKIAILYICTGKYIVFWRDFYLSCESRFIPEAEKHYFVFTDSIDVDFENDNHRIHKIYQKNLGWPGNTLKRYEIFLSIKERLIGFDYIFYLNSDVIFLKVVTALDFLPVGKEKLVACIHPGYYNKSRSRFTYETNPDSLAYIPDGQGRHYFAGGINGGKGDDFLVAIEIMAGNINADLKKDIIAVWHDESHWNKFLLGRNDLKILSPSYLFPEAGGIPLEKKIMIRDKRKYFSYVSLGKIKNRSSFNRIKKILKGVQFIRNSYLWFFIGNWIRRFKLLLTIYRFEKMAALRAYFFNDREYRKIRRFINSYKIGPVFDFNGVKMPSGSVTVDNFLNVLLPSAKKIIYTPEYIDKFYSELKTEYSTLFYWKDNVNFREPDYIGAHLISHGFTYFFKEIEVFENDVVFDIGASPGDFSALCAVKGASMIYAFDPELEDAKLLAAVRRQQPDKIELIRKFCGSVDNDDTVTLDGFVQSQNLSTVDFIKMDIEGMEADVLANAKIVLSNFKPKLAICTYHHINDDKNIMRAILEANKEYIIYREKGIIYAY